MDREQDVLLFLKYLLFQFKNNLTMRNNYPDDLKAHKTQLEQAKRVQCKTSEQAKWEWVKRE